MTSLDIQQSSSKPNRRHFKQKKTQKDGHKKKMFLTSRDKTTAKCNMVLLYMSAVFIILSSLSLYFNGPEYLLTTIISRMFKLRHDSQFYEQWQKPAGPIYFNFYVYNLTNRDNFLAGKEKANLTEIGPYIYELKMERVIINHNTTQLRYWNKRYFHFNQKLSNTLNPRKDQVWHPNLPKFQTITISPYVHKFVNMFSADMTDIFAMHSVHDFIWGYDYDIMGIINSIDSSQDEKFGMMADQNGTELFKYTVSTGYDRTEDLLKILDVNGNGPKMTCWKNSDEKSSIIQGTDMEQVPPLKHKDVNTPLWVFREDAYRSMKLEFDGKYEHPYDDGLPIPVYRFAQTRKSFEGNYCANGDCTYRNSGLVDISECRKLNFPLLWSSPHFYQSNSSFRTQVNNIGPPNADRHRTYIDIEPNTGVVISARRRVQISVVFPASDELSKLRTQIYPIFWYDLPYEASPKIKYEMSHHLVQGWTVLRVLPFLFLSAALIMVIISLGMSLKVRHVLKRKRFNDPTIVESSSGYSSDAVVDDDDSKLLQSVVIPVQITSAKGTITENVDTDSITGEKLILASHPQLIEKQNSINSSESGTVDTDKFICMTPLTSLDKRVCRPTSLSVEALVNSDKGMVCYRVPSRNAITTPNDKPFDEVISFFKQN